jgi:hypothetical protein
VQEFHHVVENIAYVYEIWHTFVGLREEIDRCLIWLKLHWSRNYLNETFMILPDAPPPPILKIRRMPFHTIQAEEDEWVNLFYSMGRIFWDSYEIMKTFIGDFAYYYLFELFLTMSPLKIQPIMAKILKQLGLELLMNP